MKGAPGRRQSIKAAGRETWVDTMTDSSEDVLSGFHPLIAGWFRERIGRPTNVQKMAWPRISSGENILIIAPTGFGKTLAAFLWAVNQLAARVYPGGQTSILYVSPLKALNNDIRRNLLGPIAELSQAFKAAGQDFPQINVRTRSGDTPQSDRRRMVRHPPEILITTPESLNLLLGSAGGRSILPTVRVVILDEIHAVVGNKRGVHLITAVERLGFLAGEFQRIALSATVKPPETVAEFVGGYRLSGPTANPVYSPRPVSIIDSRDKKEFQIRVKFPEEAVGRPVRESVWDPLTVEFKKMIGANRSTLLFTNSRRLCEKLTYKINSGEERPVAYAHHGSLSREIREEVEQKLKAGELKAIVATNSLEMGIDIGSLDEVALIQAPPSVSSAIQRVGRAGHQVGQVSRAVLFPTHSRDFLETAVLASAIIRQDIEPVKPIIGPLDVLAQVIVSMVAGRTWDMDELFVQLRTSYPYRDLSRGQFDLVINMLGGRYADSRIRELNPRVSIDRLDNTVTARKGALLALYTSGGVIPDRGYFHLRHNQTGSKIGELDEEFVWEARIGQILTLGTQNWKIERITHNDVFVVPGNPKAMATPFWRAEENGRDFHFSEQIALFLEDADERLDRPEFLDSLKNDHHMDPASAEALLSFLERQKETTGRPLPHRHHLLIEHVDSGPGGVPGNQVVLHTLWGGRVNRPYVMALEAAWEARFGQRLECHTSNDCLALLLPHDLDGQELLSLVTAARVEELLRQRLEGSGFFGARFRECAGRALLLSRFKISQRVPLWMSRLRSKKLFDAVERYEDFPILLEAWRTCLRDELDLEKLHLLLAELETGAITWSEIRTAFPSPMARSISWRQIDHYMYMGDEVAAGKTSKLRADLLDEVVFNPGLRPVVALEQVERFELKRRRLAEGYSPAGVRDLVDWVKERLLIPASEWEELWSAIRRDHGSDSAAWPKDIAGKLIWITPPLAEQPLVAALEDMARIRQAFYQNADDVFLSPLDPAEAAFISDDIKNRPVEEDPDELLTALLGEWLRFYGPTTMAFILSTLGLERSRLRSALEDLLESQTIIMGRLTPDGDDDEICDSDNFEILLRLSRADAVPAFNPLAIEYLPLFLAIHQGLGPSKESPDAFYHQLEQLLCYPLPAAFWESEVFPARRPDYNISIIDSVLQEGDLRWIGSNARQVAFCFDADLDLLSEDNGAPASMADAPEDDLLQSLPDLTDLFPDPEGRYDFSGLVRASGRSPSELAERLWGAVWRGRVTNDTFMSLRRGIETGFTLPGEAMTGPGLQARGRRMGRRSGFSKWKSALPMKGNWFRLPNVEPSEDLIDIEERKKERVRVLLDRYGILFREILKKEMPGFRWPDVFRSLRLMELSGELLAGFFFYGLPGPQFISHRAFRVIQRKLSEDVIYWFNAADPVSLCGLGLEDLRGVLPKRLDTTHLVHHGCRLVMVSERRGKSLTFHVPAGDPNLAGYLGPLKHMLYRGFRPMRRIKIETINSDDAARSDYVDVLRTGFEVLLDYKNVILYRGPSGRA